MDRKSELVQKMKAIPTQLLRANSGRPMRCQSNNSL